MSISLNGLLFMDDVYKKIELDIDRINNFINNKKKLIKDLPNTFEEFVNRVKKITNINTAITLYLKTPVFYLGHGDIPAKFIITDHEITKLNYDRFKKVCETILKNQNPNAKKGEFIITIKAKSGIILPSRDSLKVPTTLNQEYYNIWYGLTRNAQTKLQNLDEVTLNNLFKMHKEGESIIEEKYNLIQSGGYFDKQTSDNVSYYKLKYLKYKEKYNKIKRELLKI